MHHDVRQTAVRNAEDTFSSLPILEQIFTGQFLITKRIMCRHYLVVVKNWHFKALKRFRMYERLHDDRWSLMMLFRLHGDRMNAAVFPWFISSWSFAAGKNLTVLLLLLPRSFLPSSLSHCSTSSLLDSFQNIPPSLLLPPCREMLAAGMFYSCPPFSPAQLPFTFTSSTPPPLILHHSISTALVAPPPI